MTKYYSALGKDFIPKGENARSGETLFCEIYKYWLYSWKQSLNHLKYSKGCKEKCDTKTISWQFKISITITIAENCKNVAQLKRIATATGSSFRQ